MTDWMDGNWHSVLIVAELGLNHNGSYGLAW